jgi:hypothetical protein
VTEYVSQLDVYPTVKSLLGVPALPIEEGRALLLPDGGDASTPAARIFFVETGEWLWPTPAVPSDRLDYPAITALAAIEGDRIVIEERFLPVIRAAKHRAALLPPFKLVYRPTPAGVLWSLHDIDHDPFDAIDVGADHPQVVSELKAALVHSVLRHSHMTSQGGYFLTRPPSPPEEYY